MYTVAGVHEGHDENLSYISSDGKILHLETERKSRRKHHNSKVAKARRLGADVREICNKIPTGYVFCRTSPNKRFKPNIIPERVSKKFGQLKKSSLEDFSFYLIDHHYAHAAYAYYTRPAHMTQCDILAYDGWGYNTDRIFYKNLELVDESAWGLGLIYHNCCMRIYRDRWAAGKVMGWAAYGSFNKTIYGICDRFYKVIKQLNVSGLFGAEHDHCTDILEELMGRDLNDYNGSLTDICYTVQQFCEDKVIKYLERVKASNYLCIGGGCGLNGYINQKIVEKGIYKDVHVGPATDDSGLGLGAAFIVANHLGEYIHTNEIMYIGSDYRTDEEIIKELISGKQFKYTQMKYENIYRYIAEQIANKKIIGWYQGRSESGPRALGNRSILADPRNPNVKDHLDKNVKHREWYRPYAPAILKECVTDWFENVEESRYMLKICKYKRGMGEKVPAVCHIDYTGRLQTVTEEDNKHFYNLIKAFYDITDTPMVLNTSFNARGDPIVDSPEDAFMFFRNTGIDILVLKDFVIEADL